MMFDDGVGTPQITSEAASRQEGGDLPAPLTFGVYPGSGIGVPGTDGPPDDPERILPALAELQGDQETFVARAYVWYVGAGQFRQLTPREPERYVTAQRKLDLVLCFRDPQGNVRDWQDAIRAIVRQYGHLLCSLQITEEPNNPDANRGGDGASPHIHEALVQGVVAAKEAADACGYDIAVGFNATPSFNPTDPFWPRLAEHVTPTFLDALDYVGLDFFPDVFRPVAADGQPGDLQASVSAVLHHLRERQLGTAGIPASVPLHITENGWPTDPQRSEERQAVVLETILRTIAAQREALRITHYTYFNLRDLDSAQPNLWYQFGLLRDDYTPKLAFGAYRRLIHELGARRRTQQ